jgi:hypothetical protein
MTALADDKKLALKVGYKASDWANDVPYHDFEAYFSPWEALAVMKGTECIGACFFEPKTNEMHFSILPEWRKKWLTKDILARILAMPRIMTRVPAGYPFMEPILERLGFKHLSGEFWARDLNHGH